MDTVKIEPAPASDPTTDATIACALAAGAVTAWFGREVGRDVAFRRLATAMAWAGRTRQGVPGFRKPTEFLALLSRPLSQWLPVDSDEVLVDNDTPSAYCLDLV